MKRLVVRSVRCGTVLCAVLSSRIVLAAAQAQPFDQEVSHDAWPAWSPDDRRIIYTKFVPLKNEGKLFTVSSSGGSPRPFLDDKFSYGQPTWSRDGKRIAFSSNRSGSFQIWTATNEAIDLKQVSSAGDQNFQPCWSPDGSRIAYASYPNEQIMIIPSTGGKAEPFAQGFSPTWSPDGKYVAFLSTVFEGGHSLTIILVKPVTTGSPRRLSTGAFRWSGDGWPPSLDWSADGQHLLTSRPVDGKWEIATIDVVHDKLDSQIPMAGSALSPRWSHDGKRIVVSFTDTGHPATIRTFTPGSPVENITNAPSYVTAQSIHYRSPDGRQIPAFLYQPASVSGKRPAIVALHGGVPREGTIVNEFDAFTQYLVNEGFVVLAPAYRGSTGYGDDLARFEAGDDIVPDIRAGADYLKSLPEVDSQRVAVLGFSFGGYLSLLTIAREPDIFAGAIVFSGASDLIKEYQQNYFGRRLLTEIMGGTPEEKPQEYRLHSPVFIADRIKTPLLILCGTADYPAYDQMQEMASALKQAQKTYEFVEYPGAGHRFEGKDAIDAGQQVSRFLTAHLNSKK